MRHGMKHRGPFMDAAGDGGGAVTLTAQQVRDHEAAAATLTKHAAQLETVHGDLAATKALVEETNRTMTALTESVAESTKRLPSAQHLDAPRLGLSSYAPTFESAIAPVRLTGGMAPSDSRKYTPTIAADPGKTAELEGRRLSDWELDAQTTMAHLKGAHEMLMATDQAYARGEVTIRDRMPLAAARMDRITKLTSAHWDGTAGDGAEWIPTLFTSTWVDLKTLPARVQMQFQGMNRVNIPRGTGGFSHPVDTDGTTVTLLSTTAAPARALSAVGLPAGTLPATAAITHQVALHRGGGTLNEEFSEDSVGDVIAHGQAVIARDMALAWDYVLLNGQATADDGDLDGTGSADRANGAYNGLRYHGFDGGGTAHSTNHGGGALTVTALAGMRETMGINGVEPRDLVYFVDPVNYIKVVHDDQVKTADVYGNAFTLRTGELASLDGSALIYTDQMPTNLQATGDLDGGTGTTTGALAVDVTRGYVGVKNAVELRFVPRPADYQIGLYGFMRTSFAAKNNTSEDWINYLFNIASS